MLRDVCGGARPTMAHRSRRVRVPSCWGYDKATGRVRIVEKQRAQLDARFEKLFQVMAMYLEEGCRPPEDEPVFIIELFYDTVAGW